MISEVTPVKVVLDTNVVISSLLWRGIPHDILSMIEEGRIEYYATIEMLNELEEVLVREKFSTRIAKLQTSVEEIMLGLINLVNIVKLKKKINLKSRELPTDEDDIIFIQCAINAEVHYIISGDKHLLNLVKVRGIPILEPEEFVQKIRS